MKHIGIILLAWTFLAMSATLAQADLDTLPLGTSPLRMSLATVAEGKMVRTVDLQEVGVDDIVSQNPDTDVFIIGEFHDNYACHAFQRDFIEALYRRHPKLIVGFEFFTRDQNEYLAAWRSGTISEAELLERTEWYERTGQNFGFTRLIMDFIRENGIQTIGLNVPRDMVRIVSTQGFDKLPPEHQRLFPTLDMPNPDHEYYIKTIFGETAVKMDAWFTNMYAAQKCWDVIMAESMRELLARDEYNGYKGVIIAGRAHVAYGLGIPFRYRQAAPDVNLSLLIPVFAPETPEDGEEDESAHPMMKAMAGMTRPATVFSLGIGDYVFSVPRETGHYPTLGVMLKFEAGALRVTHVNDDSLAAEAGLEEGDLIMTINGQSIQSLGHFRQEFAGLVWDEVLELDVRKKIKLRREQEP
ncbi:MAG: ChaN family lipoprotein [Acidobacteria bacterium]|nr:ChaN family lipoprotein [Acidobacteriota bacterium]